MALAESLPIYRDTFDLVSLLYDYVEKYPRVYRYTLGEKTTNTALELFEYLQLANRALGNSKSRIKYIDCFLVKFELLKVTIRLAEEKKVLGYKQSANLAKLTSVIGKQANAWKKKLDEK